MSAVCLMSKVELRLLYNLTLGYLTLNNATVSTSIHSRNNEKSCILGTKSLCRNVWMDEVHKIGRGKPI